MMWMKLKKSYLKPPRESYSNRASIKCGEVYTAANLCNDFFGGSPYVDARTFERLDRMVASGVSELVLTLI